MFSVDKYSSYEVKVDLLLNRKAFSSALSCNNNKGMKIRGTSATLSVQFQ